MDSTQMNDLVNKLEMCATPILQRDLQPYLNGNNEASLFLHSLPDEFNHNSKPVELAKLVDLLSESTKIALYEKYVDKYMPPSPVNGGQVYWIRGHEDDIGDNKRNSMWDSIKQYFQNITRNRASKVIMALGALIFIVGLLLIECINDNEIPLIIMGLGTSIFTGGIINWIVELASNNDVHRIYQGAAFESWTKIRKVRYNQKIEFLFKVIDTQVVVVVTHEYYYKCKPGEEIRLSIISDTILPYTVTESDRNAPRFRFERINIEHSKHGKIEWDDIGTENTEEERERIRSLLTKTHNNKLIHDDILAITSNRPEARVEFTIHSTYNLRDRLVWSFQELSSAASEVIITIKKGEGFKDNDKSIFMWINHPLEATIRGDNRFLDRDGNILGNTSKIKFSQNILPYQGFELFWNLES